MHATRFVLVKLFGSLKCFKISMCLIFFLIICLNKMPGGEMMMVGKKLVC